MVTTEGSLGLEFDRLRAAKWFVNYFKTKSPSEDKEFETKAAEWYLRLAESDNPDLEDMKSLLTFLRKYKYYGKTDKAWADIKRQVYSWLSDLQFDRLQAAKWFVHYYRPNAPAGNELGRTAAEWYLRLAESDNPDLEDMKSLQKFLEKHRKEGGSAWTDMELQIESWVREIEKIDEEHAEK